LRAVCTLNVFKALKLASNIWRCWERLELSITQTVLNSLAFLIC
jgi:hypothetical protein